ncbi:hypothetical protein ABFX02_14G246100 [Erythranthe guttata]
MKEIVEKSLDSELWHACAGCMVKMPPVNSKVFYFPQGHAEHSLATVDFGALPMIPPMILCRVSSVKYLADHETDEVYAKIGLIPVGNNERVSYDDEDGIFGRINKSESGEKAASFPKTLTQSDANNGGGFSVPRYCAETIFPPLDYTADPPVQNVTVRDVHGETWKFRHIYRGTPRRHLLTTGWSTFVNQKKLVAGDSIVFMRAVNGDLCVGIRRARRGGGVSGNEYSSSVWNYGGGGNSGGVSDFLEDENNKLMHRSGGVGKVREKGRVRPESVVEAAFLAASCQPFEVVYCPRASAMEFCVKASSVNAAMRIHWCSGMKFKMPFETDDSSRVSWFMGTVASVQFVDPVRWPNSPWKLLQVTWDEPDLLQNVKCVSPWLVELASNMPALHLSPFSPPRKKLCLPLHHPNLPLDGRFPLPSFSGNPLGPSSSLRCLPDNNITLGIQGARHAQIGVPLTDLHFSNKQLQTGILPPPSGNLPLLEYPRANVLDRNEDGNDNVSCLLSMGNSNKKKSDDETCGAKKTPLFVLFGQPIHTEKQMSYDRPCDAFSRVALGQNASGGTKSLSTDFLCKVFLESEEVGHSVDLSALGSYKELYKKLEDMFRIDRSEIVGHLFYRDDASGAAKQVGEEPFSEFVKATKTLRILMKPGSDDTERKLVTGLPTSELGRNSSNQTGPLSIFA